MLNWVRDNASVLCDFKRSRNLSTNTEGTAGAARCFSSLGGTGTPTRSARARRDGASGIGPTAVGGFPGVSMWWTTAPIDWIRLNLTRYVR